MRAETKPRETARIALAGQPNAGKTSMFNGLTGATRNVGNYPGVTVERRDGRYDFDGVRYTVVDLPGTYSLSGFSPEEKVAQDELLDHTPDVVVVVVDSMALTRSLVFFAQILQLEVRTVLCLNMSDEARAAGQRIDTELMSELIGCPVVETQGHKRVGLDLVKAAVAEVRQAPLSRRPPVLGPRLTAAIEELEPVLERAGMPSKNREWMAAKLIVGEKLVVERVRALGEGGMDAILEATRLREHLEAESGQDIDVFVTGRYHGFAHGLLTETVTEMPKENARALSDAVDRVLVHKVLGLPFFLAVMYGIFWLTFTVGEYPMGWIERGFALLSEGLASAWPATAAPALRSMVLDGVIAGVGGVVVFLPNIVLLFLGLAVLEDTGYMARAAFLMDRLMHKFGLHGKSFLPLITGFGCSIPGIMATRTLENDRDRLITMLVLPLMSCGARLPIWMLLVPAFFAPQMRAPALAAIYLIGIVLALSLALLLRKTILKSEDAPFVMELPPYRIPTLRATALKMWDRSWLYLRKAGTVILAISVILWFVTSYPKAEPAPDTAEDTAARVNLETSIAGRVGKTLEPVFEPLGFDWKLVTAMLGAFAAKEVFVSQMGIVHSLGETDEESTTLREEIAADYSPLTGLSMILFLLIATPCMATVAVTRRESGRWSWAALQFFGLTTIGYVFALVVHQVGLLLGFG